MLNGLMIGDWVMIKDFPMKPIPMKVRAEHFVRSHVEFEPIPLTKDILISNGFKEVERRGYYNDVFELMKSYDGEEGYSNINGIGFSIELPKPMLYVHELQHILRMVGLDTFADGIII